MKRPLLFLFVSAISLVLSVGSAAWAQQDVIEKAKKEGEVAVWTHTWSGGRKVLKPFYQKYPFLKVKVWDSRSNTITAKVIEEAKAGRFIPDVIVLSTYGMTVIKDAGLLREYDWPAHVKRWEHQPKHPFWVNHATSLRTPSYHTRIVRKDEAPKSWDDLINPKWRGKAVISSSGADAPLLFAHLWQEKEGELNWEKSFDFWSRVVKTTKPKVSRGFIAPTELHASGEYPLFLVNALNIVFIFREKGAPIQPVAVGRTVGSSWGIAMPKTVPHPNAAKLFIDYLVSPEGLLNYVDANYVPVLDPQVAQRAKANVKLKEMGIDWYPVPTKIRSKENVNKATRWWANNLGVRRRRK